MIETEMHQFATWLQPEPAHRHPNGGGWVSERASVSVRAFIGPAAKVWGGEMHGGVMRGGVMRGGVMRGGVMRGGVMRGGVMRGGVMRGGVMHGGDVIENTPIQGSCGRWYYNFIENKKELRIGCQRHTLPHWKKHVDEICAHNNATPIETLIAKNAIALCTKIMKLKESK